MSKLVTSIDRFIVKDSDIRVELTPTANMSKKKLKKHLRRFITKDTDVRVEFDPTTNVFCPTGKGGGSDPSCSPKKSRGSGETVKAYYYGGSIPGPDGKTRKFLSWELSKKASKLLQHKDWIWSSDVMAVLDGKRKASLAGSKETETDITKTEMYEKLAKDPEVLNKFIKKHGFKAQAYTVDNGTLNVFVLSDKVQGEEREKILSAVKTYRGTTYSTETENQIIGEALGFPPESVKAFYEDRIKPFTTNAANKSPSPLQVDPSRTATLQRAFEEQFNRRFKTLQAAILSFAASDFEPTTNVFCPTGKGGGSDPTCSPKAKSLKPTETKAFKDWFGKSKVVDKTGKPLVVYHGSASTFDHFDSAFSMFSTKPAYVNAHLQDSGKTSQIYPSYLKAEKPLDIRSIPNQRSDALNKLKSILKRKMEGRTKSQQQALQNLIDGFRSERDIYQIINLGLRRPDMKKFFLEAGFDSLVMQDNRTTLTESVNAQTWVVFSPTQIKSSIGNRGTFDPNDPMITNAFKFQTSEAKLQNFEQWLVSKLSETMEAKDIHRDTDWWQTYIDQAYQQGSSRAYDSATSKGPAKDQRSRDQSFGAKRQFFSTPGSAQLKERLKLIAARTYKGMKGLTEQMKSQLTLALIDGMLKGENPRKLATRLTETLDISKTRAKMIARTEIIRAHSEGTLATLKALGVTKVGVQVEIAVSGNACPICQKYKNRILTIEEAEGLFPLHPNCKCTPVPYVEDSPSPSKKRQQKRIERSIKSSVKS